MPHCVLLPDAENDDGHGVRGRLVLHGQRSVGRQRPVSRRTLLPGQLDRRQSARVRRGHLLSDRVERAHAVPGGLVLHRRPRRHVGHVPAGPLLRAVVVRRHAERVPSRDLLHGRTERGDRVPARPNVSVAVDDDVDDLHGGHVLRLDGIGGRDGLLVRECVHGEAYFIYEPPRALECFLVLSLLVSFSDSWHFFSILLDLLIHGSLVVFSLVYFLL